MRQDWQAEFQNLRPGQQWREVFKAGSKQEAEDIARQKFLADPAWSSQYPVPPPVEVRMVTRAASADHHGDVAHHESAAPNAVNVRLHWADGRVQTLFNVDSQTTQITVPRDDGSFASFRCDSDEIDADGFVVFRETSRRG
jgi:hypothetical protein